ncbi:MAG: DUF4097 family beta strand repeat protein [Fimbriimonadia bacterium]|jgi:polyhydroxyalkanoate synthesis regulator phasin
MREEIQRITQMVQDGKLTPEEASDLIEAITAGSRTERAEGEEREEGARRDTFDELFKAVDRVTRDAMERVNWPEIAEKIRSATRTGWDRIKTDLEQVGRGDWKNLFGRHTEEKKQELELDIEPGATLRFDLPNGDVKVIGGSSDPKVVARAEIRGKDEEETRRRADAWTLLLEQTGDEAVLKIPGQGSGTVHTDLEVYVPAGVKLDVKTASGDVEIRNTRAAVKLTTHSGNCSISGAADRLTVVATSGDVSVKEFDGTQMTVETRSGDISLNEVHANINVRTASGDLSLNKVTGDAISAEAISGDVDVVFAEPFDGACNLRAVNGDIHIAAPDGSSCRVILSSISGEVSSGVSLRDEIRSEKRLTGTLGDGDGSLDASAISGDVSLEMKSSA